MVVANLVKVIIDTDPAIGLPFKDVDDALAILLLLSSKEADVLGLTVNFGNTKLNKAYKKAKEILSVAGRDDIPVFKGAETRKDIRKETEASSFIIETLKKYPHEITILGIAPLTNLATVGTIQPEVLKLAKEIIIMGGAVRSFPFAEFNFFMDSHASRTVLTSTANITLFPIDVCMQATFSWKDFAKLRSLRNPVSEYLCKNIFLWLLLNTPVTGRGFFPWDTVAAAYLLNKHLVRCEKFALDEKHTRWWRGKVGVKKLEPSSEQVPLNVGLKLSSKDFKAFFIKQMKNFTSS